jgi:hypothetical protein
MWLGFAELGFLSCLALAAALAISVRAKWDGRAELAVATGVVAHGLVCFPILLLGWTNLLYRSTLAVTSALFSLVALAAACWGADWRERLRDVAKAAAALARLPFDGLKSALSGGSIAVVGLLVCAASIAWTSWLSYLAPSSSWDGIWYHESIVGFALQNHGFRLVDIPLSLAFVNSFPRVCEAMNLWFVAFTDRRLVEAVNGVVSPLLILSFYVIARRYTSRIAAMGWAAGFFLIPGIVLQLRSTYIDTHIGSIFLAAILFATRPRLRIRDAWMAALAIALLGGTKGQALAWIPFLGAIVLVRLVAQHRKTRLGAASAALVGGMALIALVVAPTYIRNWTAYGNPLWPFAIDSPKLHLHFPGNLHLNDLERPWSQTFHEAYSSYTPGHDFADTLVHSHGLAIPWVVLPMAAIALPFAIAVALRGLFNKTLDARTNNLLLVALPMLATLPLSPAPWSLRYNVHVAAVLTLVAAWAAARLRTQLLGEGAAAVTIVSGIMMLAWADPGWSLTYRQATDLAEMPAPERATYNWLWHTVPTATAVARERELGPNDVVIFTDQYTFPSILWNERYSNRVVYVPFNSTEDFLARAAAVNAKWATAPAGTPEFQALHDASKDWEEVGQISITRAWTAFRRRPH